MEFYQKHDLEGRKHCGNNEWNILVSVDYSMRVLLRWCGIIINFHESKDEVFPHHRSSLCQSHFTELFNGWKEADDLNRMVHFVIIWSGNYYAGVGRRNSEKWGKRFRSHERRCESEERRKKQIIVVYPLQFFVNF